MYKTICDICGKEFETYKSNKAVCSKECRKVANKHYALDFMRKKREIEKGTTHKTCVVCKQDFVSYAVNNCVACLGCRMKKAEANSVNV